MKKLSNVIIISCLLFGFFVSAMVPRTFAAAPSAQVLGLADMSSPDTLAREALPIKIDKLAKHDFTADESVTVTVNNPDRGALTTKVLDAEGKEADVAVDQVQNGATTKIMLASTNQFTPGKYTIAVSDTQGHTSKQDFTWGVLAINTDKSIYLPGETADLSFAVLDDKGEMTCDATLALDVIDHTNKVIETLSKDNGKIVVNKTCASKEFTLTPDFEAHYKVPGVGEYTLSLRAKTAKGSYTVSDQLSVQSQRAFDVKRVSATRLYPPLEYPMQFEITANQDFTGVITETVPESFTITPAKDEQSYQSMSTLYLNDSKNPGNRLRQNVLGTSDSKLRMPFDGAYSITQGFGTALTDTLLGQFYAQYGLSGHDGVDFGLPMNTPIYSVDEGNVIWAGPGDYGNTIIIQHAWGRSYYGHLDKVDVQVSMHIVKGALLGASGNTGESTGPHLHFGMKPNNPDANNGYSGKVDPLPYLGLVGAKTTANPANALNLSFSSAVLGASTSENATADKLDSSVIASDSAAIPSGSKEKASDQTFTVSNSVINKHVANNQTIATQEVKIIKWNVSLKKGETTKLGYTYKSPEVSPQFYLLGPLQFFDTSTSATAPKEVFQEKRQWQLAADAVGVDWYNRSWQYRKQITIDHNKVVGSGAVPVFMESGGDATQDISFYDLSFNSPTVTNAQAKTGPRSIQMSTGATPNIVNLQKFGVLSDAGTRISFYLYINNYLTVDEDLLQLYTSGGAYVSTGLQLTAAHKLKATGSGTAGTTTINTGQWYRVTLAYTISSTTVNQWRVYLDGNLEASASNITITNVGSSDLRWGRMPASVPGGDTNKILYLDDLYVDNNNDLSDPGDIHITNKRPNANGAANQFATQIGAGGSGYGSGHSPQVNEQPPSSTNGWRTATANQRENYAIENAATGDVNIGTNQIIANEAWVRANGNGTCATAKITNNGYDAPITITTTSTYYTDIQSSLAYPSNSAGVGIQSCTNTTQVNIYEAGMLIAYTSSTPPLANFPVLINLPSDTNLSAKAQTNGNDIVFTDATGTVKLNHEIELYTSGTGALVAWLKVPTLSSAVDTTFYMYYGNPSASNQQNATNVWDSSTNLVQHLEETSGTTTTDSTANGFTYTKVSAISPNPTTAGKIGGAQSFNGTTDFLKRANTAGIDTMNNVVTASAWVKTTISGFSVIFSSSNVTNKGYQLEIINGKAGTWSSIGGDLDSGVAINDNQWHYVTGIWNGTTGYIYVDGVLGASGLRTFANNTLDSQIGIQCSGAGSTGCSIPTSGTIDEVRLYNINRTPGWIATEYNNQSSPSTFHTIGSEETAIYAPTNDKLMRHGQYFDTTGVLQPFVY